MIFMSVLSLIIFILLFWCIVEAAIFILTKRSTYNFIKGFLCKHEYLAEYQDPYIEEIASGRCITIDQCECFDCRKVIKKICNQCKKVLPNKHSKKTYIGFPCYKKFWCHCTLNEES